MIQPARDILNPTSDQNQFFDVGEETTALYAQANFEAGIFRGNFGLRYLETEIDSVAFGPEDTNGDRQLQSTKGKYDFVLPRLNVIADVATTCLFASVMAQISGVLILTI